MKPKRVEHKSPSRLWIGGLVLVAVIALVAVKIVQSQNVRPLPEVDARAAAAAPTLAAAVLGPQPPPAGAPAPTARPASQTAADPFPANPAAQIQWAIRNGKPAMALFHSTNCIPCKQMDKLTTLVRGDYEPRIVFVDVITNDGTNSALIRQAGIQAIPTTFFITPDGKSKRQVGAMPEAALRAELDGLLPGGR